MSIFRTFSEADRDATPNPVGGAFEALEKEYLRMSAASEKLENRIRKNSSNSNKPPSSDDPFRKKPGHEKPLKEKGEPGAMGISRTEIQRFCGSALNFPVSPGAIQKAMDRVSDAIAPHDQKIADRVRSSKTANIDETPFPKNGVLSWLRVMPLLSLPCS